MRKILCVIAGLLGLVLAGHVSADGEVEAKYRQAVMGSIGGHMTAMGIILRNQVRMDELAFHARGLASLADVAPGVFPEGSNVDKSKALPGIWENPADFKAAMDRFVEASKDMAAATQGGDMAAIGPAIQALGGACKGCHDDFKAE